MEWPLISRDTYFEEVRRRQELEAELVELRQFAPFMQIARRLKSEVEVRLTQPGAQGDIAELAYQSVYRDEVDKARRQIAGVYEAEHRTELFQRVLATVEEQDGETIRAEVQQRLETDPELALQLHNSARKELIARAEGLIADNITREQETAIESEVQRQMELDRFDVEFALSGEIDITEERITSKLQPDDKLIILFDGDEINKNQKIAAIFTWKKDVNGKVGWVFTGTLNPAVNYNSSFRKQVHTGETPGNKFVQPGSEMPDYETGETVLKEGMLRRAAPLVVAWDMSTKRPQNQKIDLMLTPEYTSHGTRHTPLTIRAIDFQTRDLKFASA